MKKDASSSPSGLIASMVTPQEYAELQDRANRILAKVPDKWKSEPRSRTVGELFDSIDESFKIVASRSRKNKSI